MREPFDPVAYREQVEAQLSAMLDRGFRYWLLPMAVVTMVLVGVVIDMVLGGR